MWVFTKDGFYSAVEDRGDNECVLVRCRAREDAAFLAGWADDFGGNVVEHVVVTTLDADYPYRVRLSKYVWSSYVACAASDIDYDNFKNTVDDDQRHFVYQRVWLALKSGFGELRAPA